MGPVTVDSFFLPINFFKEKTNCKAKDKRSKRIDRDRTRTCNPQIRSLVPYPLGHMVLVLAATKFDWVCKCIFHACVQSDKLELKYSQLVGFEPTLPKGNSFRVSRLNHSATTADTVVACVQNTV